MANLFELDNAILECIDTETGEIIDFEKFEALQLERNEKIENAALWYMNCVSDAAQYKEQKDKFAAKEKAAKARAESLKNYLTVALAGAKFKTGRVNITYRKSEAAAFDDKESFIAWAQKNGDEYLKYKDPEIDVTAVKNALKAGQKIEGAYILEKQNIQIK